MAKIMEIFIESKRRWCKDGGSVIRGDHTFRALINFVWIFGEGENRTEFLRFSGSFKWTGSPTDGSSFLFQQSILILSSTDLILSPIIPLVKRLTVDHPILPSYQSLNMQI